MEDFSAAVNAKDASAELLGLVGAEVIVVSGGVTSPAPPPGRPWQTPLPASWNVPPAAAMNCQANRVGYSVSFRTPSLVLSRITLSARCVGNVAWLRPPVPTTTSVIPTAASGPPAAPSGRKRS